MITFGSACLMRTDNSRAAKPVTTKDDRFHHPIFDKQPHVSSPPQRKQNTPVSLFNVYTTKHQRMDGAESNNGQHGYNLLLPIKKDHHL
jgi:hypothetical protein